MTLTDKTGAPITVTKDAGQFNVAVAETVEEKAVGLTAFADHAGQRVFYHTEIDDAFGGRGLATVLVGEALSMTRGEGLRIVAVCPMVAAFVGKHHDYDDVVDKPTPEILQWLSPGV